MARDAYSSEVALGDGQPGCGALDCSHGSSVRSAKEVPAFPQLLRQHPPRFAVHIPRREHDANRNGEVV